MKHAPSFLFQKHVFDASSLINIERKGQMRRLKARRNEVIMPEKVAKEVKTPGFPLYSFLEHYPEVVTSFMEEEETLYLEIRRQPGIDDGEAAAISIALNRQLPLVIDESSKRARGKAENHDINCLDSQDFIQLWGKSQ